MSQSVSSVSNSINHIHDVHSICHTECHSKHSANSKDNQECQVNQRVELARQQCQLQGIRFTKLREQVYRLILQADKPLGAYDLLNKMQQALLLSTKNSEKKSKNIAPPTVYRSLEFLLELGFVHQLTSINAFIPCCHPRDKHTAGFLICKICEHVQECSTEVLQQLMAYTKNDIGFAIDKAVIEMTGTCQACQSK